MSGQATVTFTGNTTGEASLQVTPSGVAVASVGVMVTERKKDAGGAWVDGVKLHYRASAWRDMAEHVAATFDRPGIRVTVTGRLTNARAYESNGETRVSLDVDVDTIGPDLRFGSVKVPPKADRGQSAGSYGASQGQGASATPVDDPWATGADDSSVPF